MKGNFWERQGARALGAMDTVRPAPAPAFAGGWAEIAEEIPAAPPVRGEAAPPAAPALGPVTSEIPPPPAAPAPSRASALPSPPTPWAEARRPLPEAVFADAAPAASPLSPSEAPARRAAPDPAPAETAAGLALMEKTAPAAAFPWEMDRAGSEARTPGSPPSGPRPERRFAGLPDARAASPRPEPGRRETAPEPEIRIHIGTLEIRAETAAPPAPKPRREAPKGSSLDEYLRSRDAR